MSGKHCNALAVKAMIKGISTYRYKAVFAVDIEPAAREDFLRHNEHLADDPLLVELHRNANKGTFIHSHFMQMTRCAIVKT